MVTKDEWLRSAMSDDRMVADLLLRLRHPHSPSPSFSSSSFARSSSSLLPPPRWGIRLPRTRMAYRCDGAPSCSPEKKPDSARNSPTTPLAWSTGGGGGTGDGGVSSSGTTNGFDEPALPVFRSSDSRSEVNMHALGGSGDRLSVCLLRHHLLSVRQSVFFHDRSCLLPLLTWFSSSAAAGSTFSVAGFFRQFSTSVFTLLRLSRRESTSDGLLRSVVRSHTTPLRNTPLAFSPFSPCAFYYIYIFRKNFHSEKSEIS
ncbi:hypothetical protein MLD38_006120 [Melastoma candidum]|uniref:Uncharacterized protein n=1 Tax=Melastoma candidum TaxID=119954 RepID=A0ACB9RR33_9MYRT|nr:hypothetical protein MLD38_006120 [Melastoma candidum]